MQKLHPEGKLVAWGKRLAGLSWGQVHRLTSLKSHCGFWWDIPLVEWRRIPFCYSFFYKIKNLFCACEWVYGWPRSGKEAVGSHEAGVIHSCELSEVGAGRRIWPYQEQLLTTEPSVQSSVLPWHISFLSCDFHLHMGWCTQTWGLQIHHKNRRLVHM